MISVRLRKFTEKTEDRNKEDKVGKSWKGKLMISNGRIRRVGNPHNGPTLGIMSTLSTCHTQADET